MAEEKHICYWQQHVEPNQQVPAPLLTFDFTIWIMVTGLPDNIPPEQVLEELHLPPLPHRRCVPDPRSASHCRVVCICNNAEEASELSTRICGSEFRGHYVEAVVVSELIDAIEDMEIQLSQESPNIKQDAAIAIPEIALKFAFPEHLLHRLCSTYGTIKYLRSVVTAEYACMPTIVVTYGFLSEAYAAEIALNGILFEDCILKVSLVTNLRRRETVLVQLTRGDVFQNFPQRELPEQLLQQQQLPQQQLPQQQLPEQLLQQQQLPQQQLPQQVPQEQLLEEVEFAAEPPRRDVV